MSGEILRGFGVLPLFALLLAVAHASTLSCVPVEVDLTEANAATILLSADLNVDAETLDMNYDLLLDASTVDSGSVTLTRSDTNAFEGNVSLVFPVPDRNYVLRLFVDQNNVWDCTILAYDVPRIYVTPDPAPFWTDVVSYSFYCEDASECNITVAVDGNVVGTGSEVNITLPDGKQPVTVSATDTLGYSSEQNYTFFIDSTAPSISVSSFQTLCGQDAEYYYTISVEVRDEFSGLSEGGVSAYVDGSNDNVSVENGDGGTLVNVGYLAAGHHVLTVTACDAAGNCGESNTAFTVVDPNTCAAILGPYLNGVRGHAGWYLSDVNVLYSFIGSDFDVLLDGNYPPDGSFFYSENGYNGLLVSGDGNHVVSFIPSKSEDARYDMNVSIDTTAPVLSWNYRFTPDLIVDVNAEDPVSGVYETNTCLGSVCVHGPHGEFNFPGLGDVNICVLVEDVAGNVTSECNVIHVTVNDFMGDINVPALAADVPVSLSWTRGSRYDGNFVAILDGNFIEISDSSVDVNVDSGVHVFCVALPSHLEVNRCVEFNVDLAPPVATISAPESTYSRSVTVSWSSSDDLAVVSAVLSVDGSARAVVPSGSTALSLPAGTHRICISVKDLAERSTKRCTTVRVLRSSGRGGGSYAPHPSPPRPKFPRDEIDERFIRLLDLAGITHGDVAPGKEEEIHMPADVNSLTLRASREFGRVFIPVPSVARVRHYTVDGNQYIYVLRSDVPRSRVYEYFPSNIEIYSEHLRSVARGSTLAEFSVENDTYDYVATADSPGIVLAPASVKKERKVFPEKGSEHSRRLPSISESNSSTTHTPELNALTRIEKRRHSAATPYAILAYPPRRLELAGTLVLLWFITYILAGSLGRRR